MNTLPEHFNFAAFLIEHNAARGARIAYRDDTRSLSYGALHDGIRRCAGLLRSAGLQREQRVLLLMHDNVDWPVAFLGALYAGVVPVAVNTLLTADDYAYMLQHSRAQAVLTSGALLPVLRESLAKASEVRQLWVSTPPPELRADETPFLAALDAAVPLPAPAETLADEAAFWLYSSGSTGRPKGTVHTHGNLWWTGELYGKPFLRLSENDIVFSAAKLFFAYGLGNGLTFPLMAGATTVLMAERPTPAAVFKRLVDHKPTVFYGVATLSAGMLASPQRPGRSQVALRICTSAG